jgi:hypothetical protein
MDGRGEFTFVNGNRFDGGFQNDQIHGQGTYYFANGDRYVGPWMRGQREGPGRYTNAAGQTEEMEFRSGRRAN